MCIPFQCPFKTEKKCSAAQASRKLESEKLDIKKGKHISLAKNEAK